MATSRITTGNGMRMSLRFKFADNVSGCEFGVVIDEDFWPNRMKSLLLFIVLQLYFYRSYLVEKGGSLSS
jgi:hypothetical protein